MLRPRQVIVVAIALFISISPVVAGEQFVDETDTRFPGAFDEYSSQVSIVDVDGDDDLDIVWANGRGFSFAQEEQPIRVYINDGTGEFTDETDDRTDGIEGYGRDVEFGDVDGDGDLDMVVANDFDTAPYLLLNDGDGFFTDVSDDQLPDITLGSPHVALGDVDNDGDLDLWFANGGEDRFGAGQSQLWINDGDGCFSDETADLLPEADVEEPMDAIFGDVDGDFDLDMIEGHRETNASRLYINDGTGAFTSVEFPNDSCCYSYDLGDFDDVHAGANWRLRRH